MRSRVRSRSRRSAERSTRGGPGQARAEPSELSELYATSQDAGKMSTGLQERDNGLFSPPPLTPVAGSELTGRRRVVGISFMLLVSRQGKVRLAKWFTTMSSRAKSQSAALSYLSYRWAWCWVRSSDRLS